jgi:hypothetical protein
VYDTNSTAGVKLIVRPLLACAPVMSADREQVATEVAPGLHSLTHSLTHRIYPR